MLSKLSQQQEQFNELIRNKDEAFNILSTKLEATEREHNELLKTGNFISFLCLFKNLNYRIRINIFVQLLSNVFLFL